MFSIKFNLRADSCIKIFCSEENILGEANKIFKILFLNIFT